MNQQDEAPQKGRGPIPKWPASAIAPDFEQIARQLIEPEDDAAFGTHLREAWAAIRGQAPDQVQLIAEQLRQVWNARGAADCEVVDGEGFHGFPEIQTAIRALDR
jgi:hypothetical protein